MAFDLPGWPQLVEVLVQPIRGVPQLVGLRINPEPHLWFGSDGGAGCWDWQRFSSPEEAWFAAADEVESQGADVAITAERVRSLPLAMLKESAVRVRDGASIPQVLTRVERGADGRWPEEHYREVAETYRSALGRGSAPLIAVSQKWSVSRAMASKYVKRARELGLLGYPTRRGLAGASEAQSPLLKDAADQSPPESERQG